MAIAVQSTGPAKVSVDTGASSALEELGYAAEGVQISVNPRWLDVPGDQNGGSEGPPIDVQFLGRTEVVTMELTKFDQLIYNKISESVAGATAGTVSTSGTLMAANAFRLLIEPTTEPRNYLLAFPREPQQFNRSVKHTHLLLVWECHASLGVMWNISTS